MKNFKEIICITLTVCLCCLGCSCGETSENVTPQNGQTVQVSNFEVDEFVSKEWTSDLCDDYYEDKWSHYEPCLVDFKWQNEADTFFISTSKDMSNAVEYEVEGNEFFLRGLKTETTYYWQVAKDNEKSKVYHFNTEKGVRTLYIGGVTNARDMGGWTVYDDEGKEKGFLRQGLLIRTASLDGISPNGVDCLINELNVKTELDLRAESETERRPIIDGINYINISCPQYAYSGMGIFEFDGGENSNANAVKKIISVFANEQNYPINFHCAIGRDRTGTIAFLLGALCGMSEDDLCRDYDISFFAGLDSSTPSRMHSVAFMPLVNKMKNYKDGTKSLAYNVKQYLLDIGITQEQIHSIIDVLVEEV